VKQLFQKTRLAIITLMSLFTVTVFAGLQDQVRDCYDSAENLERAAYCADMKMAVAVDNLSKPREPVKFTTLFGCTESMKPVLRKHIISKDGEIVRTTDLREFSNGSSSRRASDCRKAAISSKFQIADRMKAECQCSHEIKPRLRLVLLSSSYKEVKKISVGIFSEGSTSKRKSDCETVSLQSALCLNYPRE
jgi:hypothetical protein